jgi:competence CoiA-like predicted nuclease
MPLVAINQKNERVELWKFDKTRLIEIRDGIQSGRPAFCPDCGGLMTLKAIDSQHYVPHFAHIPSPQGDACGYGRGESQAHLLAKSSIAEYISRFEMYENAKVHIEYKIDIPDGHKPTRRADVVAIFPNGEIHVHEAQLSPITERDLGERTNDYRRVATEVVWWLGGGAATSTNEQWVQRNNAIFGRIQITQVTTEIKPVRPKSN